MEAAPLEKIPAWPTFTTELHIKYLKAIATTQENVANHVVGICTADGGYRIWLCIPSNSSKKDDQKSSKE